jgi:CRISPR-associated protein Cmr2
MSYLLLVSLGPIQDFISAARKAQDLWFGSWLLSDLARAAAVAIAGSGEGASASRVTLVFPESLTAEQDHDGPPSVANKIVARVLGDAATVRRVAQSGQDAMTARLEEHAHLVFDRIKDSREFLSEVAWKQVRDLMEYSWVAVPEAEGRYTEALDRAERSLAAVKNTKRWKQVTWGSIAPKSSIDGLRESVFRDEIHEPDAGEARDRLHLKMGERLCGVSYLKRRGAELSSDEREDPRRLPRPVFHSASHVAAATLRMRSLSDRTVGDATEAFLKALEGLGVQRSRIAVRPRRLLGLREDAASGAVCFPRWVGSGVSDFPLRSQHLEGDGGATEALNAVDNVVLYPERLLELVEDATGFAPRDIDADRLRDARAHLQTLHGTLGVSEDSLPTYYAMLLADGDNMGRYLESVGRLGGMENHRTVSKNLVAFASEAVRIIVRHGGSPVYTGGDDVLAFCPLSTVLACADALRTCFASLVIRDVPAVKEAPPTLSVGVAIAHHLANLATVRAQAKEAESLAKTQPGKNALAIIVERRSGPRIELAGSWEASGDTVRPLRHRLDEFARMLHEGAISRKTAHDVRAALVPLIGTAGNGVSSDVARSVIRGVLRQKQRGRTSQRDIEALLEQFGVALSGHHATQDTLARLRHWGDELDVAWTFCKAYRMAFGLGAPVDAIDAEARNQGAVG